MFCELMPLLGQQTLLLTLWRVSDEELLVNIVPKPVTNDRIAENNAALTTPLTVRGTPQELDEHLSRQLLEFVEAHLALSSTLKTAKEEMEAAAKAAREAARKPTKANSHSGSSGSAASRSAQVQTKTGARESSDDSESSPELTRATTPGAGEGNLGASTGNLFDLESKNDN